MVSAQVFPGDGAKLNYRIIGFSFPKDSTAGKYKLEISEGHYTDDAKFREHIVATKENEEHRMVVALPGFGKEYTWRVTGNKNGRKSPLYHFSVPKTREVDDKLYRMRIIDQAEKYGDYYIFSDVNRAMYDMKGVPVWYLPPVAGIGANAIYRDVKLTPAGTITFLADDKAFEIDYSGKVLWTVPKNGGVSGDSIERYHHEFTRLSNGHYMIMGNEVVMWKTKVKHKIDDNAPDFIKKRMQNDTGLKRTQFTTLMEYDRDGKVVWSWRSSKYFPSSDLQYYDPGYFAPIVDVHGNSFFFDEKNKVVYVNFKGISRIMKLKYPEGKILAEYGEKFVAGTPSSGNGMFCDEHSCSKTDDGYLYLFNNNACNNAMPTVVMLQEPKTEKESIKVIWEYTCNKNGLADTLTNAPKSLRGKEMTKLTSGGHVMELPGHAFFVCMNSELGKMFIVDRDKKEYWSAVPERYNEFDKKWLTTKPQYRAHIISAKDLDGLIFNSMSATK